jgi:hypothetical protein
MKRWKIIAGLLILFISGIATGVAGTIVFVERRVQHVLDGGPLAVRAAMIDRLSAKLNLDSAQKEKMAVIVGAAHEKLMAIRKRNQPEISKIIEDASLELSPLLSPAQAAKLNTLKERLIRRMGM